jgi:hypothetical protein
MIVERSVLVPASVCARWGGLLDLAVRQCCRSNGLVVPPELRQLLAEVVELGRQEAAASGSGSDAGGADGSGGTVTGTMSGSSAVAARLGLSSRAVRLAAQSGRLPGELVDGRWVFDEADVEAWARRRGA